LRYDPTASLAADRRLTREQYLSKARDNALARLSEFSQQGDNTRRTGNTTSGIIDLNTVRSGLDELCGDHEMYRNIEEVLCLKECQDATSTDY